jgi:predicted amidohydrolase YtcJ
VIPGFNDAHNHLGIHPAGWIQLQLQGPDPSWSELKDAILNAPKGVGLMADIGLKVFYDTDVNRDLLDQVAPDQPVMLSTLTYHAAILNSAAFKVVGVRTATSAYAEFAEKDKGTLEPGKLADLAVLSQDIFTVPLPDLPKTESILTLVGGKVAYDAGVLR